MTPAAARSEPTRDGLPNRIYRGRIIEALRSVKTGSTLSTSKLAQIVKPGYVLNDKTWFERLLKGLQRDGLVQIRSKTNIKLPD